MKIVFLGTNGWYDSATGNTPSILIDTKDSYLILDAGFGVAKAVQHIKKDKPVYLFLTHFHLDHICGLSALSKLPLKQPLTILSHKGLEKALDTIFVHPYASPIKELSFKIKIKELKEGHHLEPIKFECYKLDHIDLTFGYRFYLEGKVVTYCSDTKPCDNDLKLSDSADLLIHECGYNVQPADDFWGHTNPEAAGRLAALAKVKKLFLTHFGPNAFSNKSQRLLAQKRARKFFKSSFSAFDGTAIEL